MSEHLLKKRSNGRLMQLQRLCDLARIQTWRMRFQRTIKSAAGGQIDMYIVRQDVGDPTTIVTIGMGHGDTNARDFFQKLFEGIVPATAGSILLLDLYDTLEELEASGWNSPALMLTLKDQMATIRNAVVPHD